MGNNQNSRSFIWPLYLTISDLDKCYDSTILLSSQYPLEISFEMFTNVQVIHNSYTEYGV